MGPSETQRAEWSGAPFWGLHFGPRCPWQVPYNMVPPQGISLVVGKET